jgi:hypothetical protein
MHKLRKAPGKILPWLVTGAVVGGLTGIADGAVLGAILGNLWSWIGLCVAAGAIVGALLAMAARALLPRMVLRPPGEEEADVEDEVRC